MNDFPEWERFVAWVERRYGNAVQQREFLDTLLLILSKYSGHYELDSLQEVLKELITPAHETLKDEDFDLSSYVADSFGDQWLAMADGQVKAKAGSSEALMHELLGLELRAVVIHAPRSNVIHLVPGGEVTN